MFFRDCFSFDDSPFIVRPSCSPHLDLTNSIKPPIKLQRKWGQGDIIGSVNGLICFYYQSLPRDYVNYIWNPSLTALLTLPRSRLSSLQLHIGFGFDPENDNYKIVKLEVVSLAPNKVVQCEVYSTRKGSWEPISQSLPSHIENCAFHNNQVCVADRLHWLGTIISKWVPKTIVAFDLGGEAFIEIPLPDSIRHQLENRMDVLGVLSGKLCVISCVRDGGECVVWLMGEYGVAGSWVKHHVFPSFSGNIIPYRFTSHCLFLFQVDEDDDRFGLYDPIAAKTKTFKITSEFSYCKVVEYVDSLVWIQPATNCLHIRREINKTTFV